MTKLIGAEDPVARLPLVSSTFTVAVPRLLPEVIVEDRSLIASCVDSAVVTVTAVVADVSPALLAVIV